MSQQSCKILWHNVTSCDGILWIGLYLFSLTRFASENATFTVTRSPAVDDMRQSTTRRICLLQAATVYAVMQTDVSALSRLFHRINHHQRTPSVSEITAAAAAVRIRRCLGKLLHRLRFLYMFFFSLVRMAEWWKQTQTRVMSHAHVAAT